MCCFKPQITNVLNTSHSQVYSETDTYPSEYNAKTTVSFIRISFMSILSASIKVCDERKVDGALAIRLVSLLLFVLARINILGQAC